LNSQKKLRTQDLAAAPTRLAEAASTVALIVSTLKVEGNEVDPFVMIDRGSWDYLQTAVAKWNVAFEDTLKALDSFQKGR
jgi:hypothetical protein